jgi:signal transduction histidine kinase
MAVHSMDSGSSASTAMASAITCPVPGAAVLDEADAERRRIERDLHDGAQQRLVSLAMNLGMARASLADLPEGARKVIEEAHDEAKEALAELRNLVRGLHPAILEDRGLDAALSGIAARAPFPVRVRTTGWVALIPDRAPAWPGWPAGPGPWTGPSLCPARPVGRQRSWWSCRAHRDR